MPFARAALSQREQRHGDRTGAPEFSQGLRRMQTYHLGVRMTTDETPHFVAPTPAGLNFKMLPAGVSSVIMIPNQA